MPSWLGYGSTCDAYHITSPDPSAAESARAIADAWRETSLDTDRVYYQRPRHRHAYE